LTTVAVIAHVGKTLGGGLSQLRKALEVRGVGDPLWYDVAKSKQIPEVAREALKAGADLVFVWGGDGPACWPTRSTRSCSIRTPAPAGPAARRGF